MHVMFFPGFLRVFKGFQKFFRSLVKFSRIFSMLLFGSGDFYLPSRPVLPPTETT